MTPDEPAEKQKGFQTVPSKQYQVAAPRPKAFMVEDAQWERLRERVDTLEAGRGIDWLVTAASTVGSIGVSALLALIALPQATEGSELSAGVKPALWAVFIGGVALAVALG